MTAEQIMSRSEAPVATGAAGLAGYSRFVQRVRRRYAPELALLPAGVPDPDAMAHCLDALLRRGHDIGAALRVLRQVVLERLAVLDCEQAASLESVVQAMTDLADLALDRACTETFRVLDAQHGAPLAASGARAHLWVVGMGKLGGRELNVSSDIDLVYVYDEDGHTAGAVDGAAISVREYFTRAVRMIHALLGDVTEHGFVFRIDLALRPNGNSGPSVCSLEALRDYMLVQGREWERFAWLKSRVVAPRAAIADTSARALRTVVLPFVFRRYLDYNVFDSLRVLHGQIRDHATKRSAGRPARANDVKLSRGGIREVEFTVQLPQLVRGGQFPELRNRSTLIALERLAHADLMSRDVADALARAYVFLRRVEHRIQYLDDQQTHILPSGDADVDWIARTLGCPDSAAFLAQLCEHREFVAGQFDRLLGEQKPCKHCRHLEPQAPAPAITALADAESGFSDDAARAQLRHWREKAAAGDISARVLDRLAQLMTRTADWLRAGRVTELGARRFMDWIDSLLRRENYLALMVERPVTHERVMHVLGAARWPAAFLTLHPAVIDELANRDLLEGRFDAATFERTVQERRAALARTGEDHEENLLNLLRRAQHAALFRTLVRDLEGRITVEQVADDLSALADAVLRLALRWAWPLVRRHHRDQPRLGCIGYGKLGGKELGYGSDLDLVFVFDDDDERATEAYSALVRKLISWLTAKTGEGDLYEVDTALRPNGHSGLLVTSFAAYADYQERRGSNTAWTWEHQAMTRARMVPPSPLAAPGGFDLTARFDAVRHVVITAPRDLAALRKEVVAMRATMRQAHPVPAGQFDLKHGPGGLVDAEFVTQYLVLAHSREHPELEPNLGNIALLIRAEDAGLLPAGVGRAAAAAYRALRHAQHRARLNEQAAQMPLGTLAAEQSAIETLWRAVFAAA